MNRLPMPPERVRLPIAAVCLAFGVAVLLAEAYLTRLPAPLVLCAVLSVAGSSAYLAARDRRQR